MGTKASEPSELQQRAAALTPWAPLGPHADGPQATGPRPFPAASLLRRLFGPNVHVAPHQFWASARDVIK